MSKRTGFSVEALGELKFAAEQSGAGLDTVEKAAKRMVSVIADADAGLKTSTDALDGLGLSVKDLKALSPEQQFDAIGLALAGIEDPSLKAALAQDAFGRAGTDLLPFFDEGADGMEELRQKAQDLGVVMSGEGRDRGSRFQRCPERIEVGAIWRVPHRRRKGSP